MVVIFFINFSGRKRESDLGFSEYWEPQPSDGSLTDKRLLAMSAFLPESDSEDELPPGWEERATLQGEVKNILSTLIVGISLIYKNQLQVYYANHDQSSTQWQHPRTGRRKTVGENLPFGWERRILEDNKVPFMFECSLFHYIVRLCMWTLSTRRPHLPILAWLLQRRLSLPLQPLDRNLILEALHCRFVRSHTWTTESNCPCQVAHGRDLTGQVALITGANSGVGWQTARTLALQGCQVLTVPYFSRLFLSLAP